MGLDTGYLTTQVTTIIGQLHSVFDEIGIPKNERDARETELFAALSDTLHNQLRLVNTEKSELTEEANKIIKTIKQMEKSLDDDKSDRSYGIDTGSLRVTYPLNRCVQALKEKLHTISKLHRERFEQVKKLVEALESYSSHLEPSFVKIALPPTSANSCPPEFDLSPSYVTTLDREFSRVYEEYTRRVALVGQIAEEIIKMWAELGTPQAQTDGAIVKYYREAPEQLGLHESDLANIKSKRDKLVDEKKGRERRLKELRCTIEGLWDRLGVEEPDRKAFLAANRGCGMRTINEFEDELARLNELKRQNLHLFVEDARCRLQELWDSLYFSEEEMLDFTPAFSDVFSDALLSAHEAEIERLEALKEQRAPTLALVDRHRSLINDREALAASANDASRLTGRGTKGEKRDPTRLLREEKMRKRIAKELPKLEGDLRRVLEQWEDEYGRPFLVHGERYIDELDAAAARVPPPRSKTPSGPAPSRGNSTASKTSAPSRPGSSMRGPPPPRQATKTPTSTMRRNPMNSSTSTGPPTAQKTSPSKIPARKPLGLSHGNTSPERRLQVSQPTRTDNTGADAVGKMGPPRAPPPKLRGLFEPPRDQTPVMGHADGFQQPPSALSSSTSNSSSNFVRPMSPDDVYDDRIERMSYMSASLLNRDRQENGMGCRPPGAAHKFQDFHSSMQRHYPPAGSMAPPPLSRQTSNQSGSSQLTANTATTGSENWESYGDDESVVSERDARDAYYDKVRAATNKRPYGPEGGFIAPPSKRNMNLGLRSQTVVEVEGESGQTYRVGSDAGWTDDTNDN
ncbi:MAG: hypothetical protein Q9227_005234 [Pyrenula ochraceoflavens]